MIPFGLEVWDRMVSAVEKVRERLIRATAILEDARIPYAVIGGNAVAAWVARIDEAAVRNTRDVDLMIRRDDLPAAIAAMERNGFRYRHVRSIDMFLDGPATSVRDAVHLLFAGEKTRPDDPFPTPDVSEVETSADGRYRHITLAGLVQLKLLAFRPKDQTHLQDLASVNLIDQTWPEKFPSPLRERLQEILSTPEAQYAPNELE